MSLALIAWIGFELMGQQSTRLKELDEESAECDGVRDEDTSAILS